ncbi:unnamed protein product [Mucor hiemalis]
MAQQPTTFQQKASALPSYRSIAIAPAKILPRPERRNSNSSQGSNSSISAAADQRVRRKEQNRAAQRAFRERKERYVKELEDRIKEIEAAHAIQVTELEQENEKLRHAMENMQKKLNEADKARDASTTVKNVKDIAQVSPPYSNAQSPVTSKTTSPAATSATTRVPSSAVACIRDKDGVSFCERLKEEVCSDAYDQLLTEPLFDSHGLLNDSVAKHPVPIVTTELPSDKRERSLSELFSEFEQTLSANLSPSKDTPNKDLISCSVVWNRMAQHPLFNKFDLEELCDELKKRAKCSRNGPVFEEYEVEEVLNLMANSVRQEEEPNQNENET